MTRLPLLALITLALAPASAQAADGKIVFHSARDGDFEIYEMDGDGSDVRRITDSAEWDQFPRWSPDGRRIAFASRRFGTEEIMVMGADGSAPARLTTGLDRYSVNTSPAWSPDGAFVVYDSNDAYGNGVNLFRVSAQGGAPTQLTRGDVGNAWGNVSPDGSRVVFGSYVGAGEPETDLVVMNADGSGIVPLTDTPDVYEGTPRWSPDGSRIAYTASRPGGASWIETVAADGSDRRTVTNGPDDFSPAWSPTGDRLLFDRQQTSTMGARQTQLFVVPASGGRARQLTFGIDYWHNGGADWVAGDVPDAPAGRLRRLDARVVAGHLKVHLGMSGPARVRLTVERGGRQILRKRADAGAEAPEVYLMKLPGGGRYTITARSGARTERATVRMRG